MGRANRRRSRKSIFRDPKMLSFLMKTEKYDIIKIRPPFFANEAKERAHETQEDSTIFVEAWPEVS